MTMVASRTGTRSRAAQRPCHPLTDQAELRYRTQCDLGALRAGRTPTGHADDDDLVVWLDAAIAGLQAQPVSVQELVDIAAQWRVRRRTHFDDAEWAVVCPVAALDRPAASWRWRFWHGDQPRPPRPVAGSRSR